MSAFSTKNQRVRFLKQQSTCRLFQRKSDLSAFLTINRRVGFSNDKSKCRLFQRKTDVSAFPTKNRCVGFSNRKSTDRLFPLSRRYKQRLEIPRKYGSYTARSSVRVCYICGHSRLRSMDENPGFSNALWSSEYEYLGYFYKKLLVRNCPHSQPTPNSIQDCPRTLLPLPGVSRIFRRRRFETILLNFAWNSRYDLW